MAYYTYNADAQRKASPMTREPYIKNVPQNKLWTPKEGTWRIRFLPPWSPAGLYSKFTQIHWEVGLAKSTFICPDMLRGGTCPYCMLYTTLRQEYDKYEPDVSASRPAKRWYSNIVDLNNPGIGVLVYSYGKTIYQQVQGIQDSGEYGDISNPVSGTDFTITRTGQGRNSKDALFPARQPTPLQNPNWLDQMYNLDDIFIFPTMDDVNAAFQSQPWKVWRAVGGGSAPTTAAIPTSIPPPATTPPPTINAPIAAPAQPAPVAVPVQAVPAVSVVMPAPAQTAPVATPAQVAPVEAAPANVADRFAAVDQLEAQLKAKLQASS